MQVDCTFDLLPIELQERCGLPSPLCRRLVGRPGIGGSFADPHCFMKCLFENDEEGFKRFLREFFQGKCDTQMVADGIDKQKVVEYIDFLERTDKLPDELRASLKTLYMYGPRVISDEQGTCRTRKANGAMLRIIFGVIFRAGSLAHANSPFSSLLGALYPDDFKEASMLAAAFHADPTLNLSHIFTFNFTYDGHYLKSWCLEMLGNYNTNLEDRYSVMHVLLDDACMKDMQHVFKGRAIRHTFSRLVRVCLQSIEWHEAILQTAFKERQFVVGTFLNALFDTLETRLNKLICSLNLLLKELHLEKADVVSVLKGDHSTPELTKKYSSIFFFVQPEKLPEYYQLLPLDLYATLGIDEKAAYICKSNRPIEIYGLVDSDKWAILRVLEGIARGTVDHKVLKDNIPVLRKMVETLTVSQRSSLSELLCTLNDDQIQKIKQVIEPSKECEVLLPHESLARVLKQVLKLYDHRKLDMNDFPDPVIVKIKFPPVYYRQENFVISVPSSCRIVDLYWIIHSTRVNGVVIYPMTTQDGRVLSFTELVKDHPNLQFIYDHHTYGETWFRQHIEEVKEMERKNQN